MRQSIGLLLCFLLLLVATTAQQDVTGDWSAVTALPAGTPVEVRRQNGVTVTGTIASASPTTLALTLKSGTATSIDRQSITLVYRSEGRHVVQGGAIGGVIGAAAGAGIGAASCGPNHFCTRGQGAGVGVAILGVLGVVIGATIGLHRSKSLIYRRQN
jgi:hypothetical protein